MKKRILLALALLPVVAFVGKLYLTQNTIIYPRHEMNKVPPPSAEEAAFDSIRLTAPDGTQLAGVLFPFADGKPAPKSAPSTTLILAFGGNAHDVVGMATFLKNTVFPQPNVAVAGFSYRGYGNALGTVSGGEPSEPALKADAVYLYDTFSERLHPDNVVVIGYSLGTAVGAYLATQRPVSHLVMVAPPASIRRLSQERYPWLPMSLLLKSPWATEDILGSIHTPVTALYTSTDGLIPPSHITILKHANPALRVVPVEGTTHGDILNHPAMPQLFRQTLSTTIPL